MPGVQTEGEQKTAEELQTELDAALKSYNNLTTAHEKLKTDHKALKEAQSDSAELMKQIEKLHNEKAKLLTQADEVQVAFDDYRNQVQQKDLKVTLLSSLAEVSKSPETCYKLLDVSAIKLENGQPTKESLTAAIDALKVSDPILFTDAAAPKPGPVTPPIKPALDRQVQSGYETEVAAAVKAGNQKQLEEVLAKYGLPS